MTAKRSVALSSLIIAALLLAGCGRVPQKATDRPTASDPSLSQSAWGRGEQNERRVLPPKIMEVNGIPVQVDIARTPQEKMQGLSGRAALPEGRGMLFPYDEPVTPAFWMNGMLFSIDIIWISNGKVVDISENLPYPAAPQAVSRLPTYSPRMPVTGVLEVPAGWARRYGVKEGAEVVMPGI